MNQLSIERDALRLAREKEEPLVRQLEVETTQLQAQIDLLNRQQLQIKNESHTVKAASQEVLDQSAAVKVELTNLRTENSRLKYVHHRVIGPWLTSRLGTKSFRCPKRLRR